METIPNQGLARKAMGDGRWLVLVLGGCALSVVVYSLQPSQQQYNLVRDLHADFERANLLSLQLGLASQKMVFPQRALLV
ncbi:MAG: hypothetical protein H7Y11_00080 [Armatimonadetes bacterium]|nr:hypothetical protein [Anaerolineae bacterium]